MKTIHLDFDRDIWLYVPEAWPFNDFANVDEWSSTIGRLFAESAGVDPKVGEALAATVRTIALETPEEESRFVYMGDAFNFIFFVSIIQLETDKSISLEDLASVDDDAVTRPVELTTMRSRGMGKGLRSVRYVDSGDADHSIALIAQYAWRAKGLDVVMIASSFDVVTLDVLLPVVDELALSVSVVKA
jgi:hypothetical protein